MDVPMASVPTPSSARRRLAELLEEQQEPFMLDVYLLENGCSKRIMCTDESTTLCWPGNACRRLQRLASHGFRRRREGILRCLLAMSIHGKPRKRSNWGRKALESRRFSVGMKTDLPESDRLSCSGETDAVELFNLKVDAERNHEWECMEEQAKQHSPVSVLELHSDDGSPTYEHIQEENPSISSLNPPVEASDISEEFHGTASISSIGYLKTERELHGTKQLLLDCVAEVEKSHEWQQMVWHFHENLGHQRTGKIRFEQDFTWRMQAGDATTTTYLIEYSVVTESRKEWSHFQPHMREIGTEIADTIFDELIEDVVSCMKDFFCTWKTC